MSGDKRPIGQIIAQFVILGSAPRKLVPRPPESLAGRIEYVDIHGIDGVVKLSPFEFPDRLTDLVPPPHTMGRRACTSAHAQRTVEKTPAEVPLAVLFL